MLFFFLLYFTFCKWFSVHAQIIMARCLFLNHFESMKWKINLFFSFFLSFFPVRYLMMMSPMLTCLSARLDTCKRAWVLVCMYVRTCVSGKADLYVQTLISRIAKVVHTTKPGWSLRELLSPCVPIFLCVCVCAFHINPTT